MSQEASVHQESRLCLRDDPALSRSPLKTLPVWAGLIMGAWFGAMLLLAVVAVAALGVWGVEGPTNFPKETSRSAEALTRTRGLPLQSAPREGQDPIERGSR